MKLPEFSLEKLVRNPEDVVETSSLGFSEALILSAVSGVAAAAVAGIQLQLAGLTGAKTTVALALSGVLLGLIGPAMSAATVHPLVYYFGGREYEKTYKVFAFHSPVSVLGAVAGLNILALPAVLALETRAVKRVHSLSRVQAALTLGIPGLGLVAVGAAVVLLLGSLGALPPIIPPLLG